MINEEEEFKYLENPNIWTTYVVFLNKNNIYLADKKRIINIEILAWNSLIIITSINN